MKFIKSIILLLVIMAAATSLRINTMQRFTSAKKSSENHRVEVGINDGKWITIPVKSADGHTLCTNSLKGCVVTILDLEYKNGDRTIFMSHFAYYEKNQNQTTLNNFLKMHNLKNIKKASCLIIPPGIYKKSLGKSITPILDKAWEAMIIKTVTEHFPQITIQITPYLFNTVFSSVYYSLKSNKESLEIVNKTPIMDKENKNLLFETHNYETKDNRFKVAMVPVIAGVLLGFSIYYLTK